MSYPDETSKKNHITATIETETSSRKGHEFQERSNLAEPGQ